MLERAFAKLQRGLFTHFVDLQCGEHFSVFYVNDVANIVVVTVLRKGKLASAE